MKIAVLGTGMVGHAIGSKLLSGGHEVTMGSRAVDSEAAQQWLRSIGGKGRAGTFADAAASAEIIFDCTNGANSLTALRQAEAANMNGKILIQIANPLDFSHGMPPSLTVCNTDSLAEQVQREFPEVRLVKTLNTMSYKIMVEPSLVPGDHTLFICGDDPAARLEVADHLCDWFGWRRGNILDLGDITASRGLEMFLPLWLRIWGTLGKAPFNIHVVKSDGVQSRATPEKNIA
jgi:predicted dinucleotide-binding enzyme